MHLQLCTTEPRYIILYVAQKKNLKAINNLLLLINIDINVNGIPYNLTFLCTTCNQPF